MMHLLALGHKPGEIHGNAVMITIAASDGDAYER
jgi:hypothetical protein